MLVSIKREMKATLCSDCIKGGKKHACSHEPRCVRAPMELYHLCSGGRHPSEFTGCGMIPLNREHGCNWQPSVSTISGHLVLTALQGHEGQMGENLKQHNFDMQALLEAWCAATLRGDHFMCGASLPFCCCYTISLLGKKVPFLLSFCCMSVLCMKGLQV